MNYKQSLEYLEEIAPRGIVPGLDSIRELCARLGDPQNAVKWIHVTGTNGKGSTVAYVSTILKAAGYRVGRYV
ncbi:MAG: bifunctional folylpolyglutamate synthase/dihydrofolate synthase, partial [Lachnospiraceae bacterium]|nr:bifunctional folylpolyglutamate synthase/dihydrofolate synthase [Lachnospiraceae bacterium]